MSEAQTTDLTDRDAINLTNLKKHGGVYGLAVIAGLTLFGAAHS